MGTANRVPVFGDCIGGLDDTDVFHSVARVEGKEAVVLVGRQIKRVPFNHLEYHSNVGSVQYFLYLSAVERERATKPATSWDVKFQVDGWTQRYKSIEAPSKDSAINKAVVRLAADLNVNIPAAWNRVRRSTSKITVTEVSP